MKAVVSSQTECASSAPIQLSIQQLIKIGISTLLGVLAKQIAQIKRQVLKQLTSSLTPRMECAKQSG
jgi:hypothetical protein